MTRAGRYGPGRAPIGSAVPAISVTAVRCAGTGAACLLASLRVPLTRTSPASGSSPLSRQPVVRCTQATSSVRRSSAPGMAGRHHPVPVPLAIGL